MNSPETQIDWYVDDYYPIEEEAIYFSPYQSPIDSQDKNSTEQTQNTQISVKANIQEEEKDPIEDKIQKINCVRDLTDSYQNGARFIILPREHFALLRTDSRRQCQKLTNTYAFFE